MANSYFIQFGEKIHSKAVHSKQCVEVAESRGLWHTQAPEVFRHEPYNTKVDVYAFAMLCFELFEGRAPFDGWDPVECAKAVALQGERPIMIKLDKENVSIPCDLRDSLNLSHAVGSGCSSLNVLVGMRGRILCEWT
jgi:serine/threonine protein kinase